MLLRSMYMFHVYVPCICSMYMFREILKPVQTNILYSVHLAMAPNQRAEDAEAKVRDWGFSHVFAWTDGP